MAKLTTIGNFPELNIQSTECRSKAGRMEVLRKDVNISRTSIGRNSCIQPSNYFSCEVAKSGSSHLNRWDGAVSATEFQDCHQTVLCHLVGRVEEQDSREVAKLQRLQRQRGRCVNWFPELHNIAGLRNKNEHLFFFLNKRRPPNLVVYSDLSNPTGHIWVSQYIPTFGRQAAMIKVHRH